MTEAVKKNGLNFGIIIAVISILVTVLMYAVDVKLFANYWVGIILFIVNLVLGIIAVAKAKKALGGFISFKDAFTTFFIAMALGAFISTLFTYVLFNLVDPEAKEVIMDEVITKTVTMMEGMGTPSDDMRTMIEEMKKTDNFSLGSVAKSYVFGLIFYIIVGLIVAAAMKKNKPEFE